MSVARTIVEITIDVGYIASDPAMLVPRFIGYAGMRDDQLARSAMLLLVDTAVDIFNLPEPFHQGVRRLNLALCAAEGAPSQQ
jgi:hypothetical protein